MRDKLQPYGGRKFFIAVLTILLTAALTYTKSLDAGSYVAIALGITATFTGGNVIESVKNKPLEVAKAE